MESIPLEDKPKSPRFDRAAHVSERALISGFLVKQGAIERKERLIPLGKLRKNWKSRFFVLEAGYLTYYASMEAYPTKPSGRIDLRHVTDAKERENIGIFRLVITCIGPKAMLFEITEGRRTYYIQAESEQKRKEWIDAIKLEMKRLGK